MSGMGGLDDWLSKVEDFADEVPDLGARTLTESIDDQLRSATGGDGALSRHKGGAATIESDVTNRSAEVRASGSMGVWAIIEDGTRPHTVNARPGSALWTPYGPKAMVQVSGIAAPHTWTNGVEIGMPQVEQALDAEFAKLG